MATQKSNKPVPTGRTSQDDELRAKLEQIDGEELLALNYLARLYIRRKREPNPETAFEIARMEEGLRAYVDVDAPPPFVPVPSMRH
ncbi:MAG: hypothetical protein ABI624_16605 [Casimicrobiaceae bacterium]